MKSTQLDLFESQKTETSHPAPTAEQVYHILAAGEKVRPGKVKKSQALDAAAAILENPDVKMNKRERQAGMIMGRTIKQALVLMPRAQRADAVKDAAWMMGLADDGHPVSKNDLLMNQTQMGEIL